MTADDPPLQPLGKPRRRDHSEMFTKAVAQAMQEAMEPIEVPSVLRNSGRRALLRVGARFAIAAAVAAGIAMILVMAIPASQSPGVRSNAVASIASSWQSLKTSLFPAPQRKRAATLAVEDSSGLADDPLPLGVRVGAPPPGAVIAIGGLPAGARLTAGKRVAANEWRVPASEISAVSVIPPDGFVGQMVVTVELRDGDGAALVGSSIRLSWKPAASVAAQPPAAVVAAAPARPAAASPPPQMDTVRNLDPKEISVVVKRGQDLLASGDIAAARLLLLRAAEARDARAALLLARTYDPIVLKQLGASGPLADLAQARNWYQKAKEWGEPEAQRQLDALAPIR
ncbi:hypothetical protein OZ411_22175 [Bradyrhizobium sp. Arg237L]|uniref:hypothetical protein n=1 Tax=Bradyrhizobium sp. Arg237L TaxID=3003352 RepID=UPI00249F07CE|nr:hypothetical protein [Bradyrhizobium sp. Arg237L]MDI4235520.1 hypothetical protein [Bradyrhizobium sp. Arg237L]